MTLLSDTTSRVIAERRLGTLRDMVQTTSTAQTVAAFYEAAIVSFSRNPYDFPFLVSRPVLLL